MPNAPFRTALGLLALTSPLAIATSCSSTTDSGDRVAESEWIEPSPDLERQINIRAMKVSVAANEMEYAELFEWFAGVGESAYPKLIEMIESGDKRQRSFALTVAGAVGDIRLAQPIEAAMPSAALEDRQHRYEYARALAKLGEFSELPILIEGLMDENEFTRAQAYKALKEVTNNDIEYSASAPEEERRRSMEAWSAWWEVQRADTMLQPEE